MNEFSYFAAGDITKSEPEPKENITFEEFMNRVRGPVYAAFTDFVKSKPYGSDEYREAKKVLPFITPHAVVKRKCNDAVIVRSGIFCYDLDIKDNPGIDVANLRDLLKKNPYCYGFHSSTSGGVSFYIRVDVDVEKWDNHNREYMTVFDELQRLYDVSLDKAQKAISQARYCSHDADAFYNPEARAKKIKVEAMIPRPALNITDGESSQVVESVKAWLASSGETITKTYDEWTYVGFALANTFPEATARTYFHEISAVDSCYDFDECDGVWERIARSVSNGTSKSKLTLAYIIDQARGKGWQVPEGIKSSIPDKPKQAYQTKKGEAIRDFLDFVAGDYDIRRNQISTLLDIDGRQMTDADFHDLWMDAHMIHGINISMDDIYRVLDSAVTPTYNPLREYFKSLPQPPKNAESLIYRLTTTITQDTYDAPFFWTLIKKWMTATVAGIHDGEKNILQLVFSGSQNTGKTEFFRRLLPDGLHQYYAENKLDDGKDAEILMCQKLIIMDDEFGGKSKMEVKRIKELSSKAEVTVRLPYGKTPVTMQRIATLCGTTNEPEILGDTTGNRRIIPVNIVGRDFAAFDAIDKEKLWAEAYALYISGFDYELTKEEIARLDPLTQKFQRHSMERELINQYFSLPDSNTSKSELVYMSASEILVHLKRETGLTNVNKVQIGRELSSLGFEQQTKKVNGTTARQYVLIKKILY